MHRLRDEIGALLRAPAAAHWPSRRPSARQLPRAQLPRTAAAGRTRRRRVEAVLAAEFKNAVEESKERVCASLTGRPVLFW